MAETWVEASGRSGAFVDPRGHLLNDEAAQKQFGFNMATSYDRAQRRLLLQDLNVFLTPGEPPPPARNTSVQRKCRK